MKLPFCVTLFNLFWNSAQNNLLFIILFFSSHSVLVIRLAIEQNKKDQTFWPLQFNNVTDVTNLKEVVLKSEKWVMPSHEWYSTWVIVYHFTSRWIGPFYATHSHTRSGVGWKWWWREPRQKSSKLVFFFFQSSFACVVFSCLLIGCTRDGRQCHWFRQGHVTFVANLWFFATKVRAISWLWAECWQQPVMPEILVNEYECLKKLQLKDLVLMLDTSRHKIIHKTLHLATLAAAESCSI